MESRTALIPNAAFVFVFQLALCASLGGVGWITSAKPIAANPLPVIAFRCRTFSCSSGDAADAAHQVECTHTNRVRAGANFVAPRKGFRFQSFAANRAFSAAPPYILQIK